MKVTIVLVSIIACCGHSASHAAEPCRIERVEPGSWWQGFRESELQLLVHGRNVAELSPRIDYPGIRIDRVVQVASPNYLFVYLDIDPSARAGQFDIVFSGDGARLTHSYTLRAKNADPEHARGFSTSDAIYLITPDRFANGDPANDNVDGFADEVDRDQWLGRHGGDIQGIADHLGYVRDMGFTAIWLNPLLENAMPEASYHGYSTTDFYRVDPRYGSNDEYLRLVRDAKKKGIGVIMDMIVNHIGSRHWWMEDLPTADWLNHQGNAVMTSHERTALQDPYAADVDKRDFADGWFVPSMPDLNQRNPLLADYLIQNALWWIEYLGLAGIRMDTYPYPDKAFMAEWTRRVMQEYPEFNVVGEEWSVNQPTVAYWQRGKENHDGYVSWLPGLMDFPLQGALRAALTEEQRPNQSAWMGLYRALANDFLYADPGALVIFADNHDMSRIYTQLGEDYDLFRMAMVYVLTMRGTPQIYYGTEILMHNRESEDHGLIRSDFPGGWPDDRVDAFSGRGLGRDAKAAQSFMRKLLNWRKSNEAVHTGRVLQYMPKDGVYVYFRIGGQDQRVMVAMNMNRREVRLPTGRFAEGIAGSRSGRDVLSGERHSLAEYIDIPARGALLLQLVR